MIATRCRSSTPCSSSYLAISACAQQRPIDRERLTRFCFCADNMAEGEPRGKGRSRGGVTASVCDGNVREKGGRGGGHPSELSASAEDRMLCSVSNLSGEGLEYIAVVVAVDGRPWLDLNEPMVAWQERRPKRMCACRAIAVSQLLLLSSEQSSGCDDNEFVLGHAPQAEEQACNGTHRCVCASGPRRTTL